MRSILDLGALSSADRSLGKLLSAHQRTARVGVAVLALSFVFLAAQLGTSQAALPQPSTPPRSILPTNIGIGVGTADAVTLSFPAPMNRATVEAGLTVAPDVDVVLRWAQDGRSVAVLPASRWQTDARYELTVGDTARDAAGHALAAPVRASFTTQTAPRVSTFTLGFPSASDGMAEPPMGGAELAGLANPDDTPATDGVRAVSTGTAITVGFSAAMDHEDTERHFLISPEVPGSLYWSGTALVFVPSSRLPTGARYTVTVAGAHDALGNLLGGDPTFSFTTWAGAQVVKTSPAGGAKGVDPGPIVVWFSRPMDRGVTAAAVTVSDETTGETVEGSAAWNRASTQLTFTPGSPLALGRTFRVQVGTGAQDIDANAVSFSWAFSTKAPPQLAATVRTPVTGPPPPADLAEYALWQINQSRAAYGFAPLVLDPAISAVASGHAWDMANYRYFSHTGRDGSTASDRLRRGGVSFGWSGENICYYNGIGTKAMLNWCHRTFMSEPYPGVANHIGNILGPHYKRIGVGIAKVGTRVYIVWDFAG